MIPVAVTIAGSDSGGGAGIQADLKTFAANEVFGTSVITALTAQNTQGVSAIHDVPLVFIAAQIESIFSDFDIAAVKIGMLSRAETIRVVAAELRRRQAKHIVLDPVMVATSGDRLLAEDAIVALRTELMPLAEIVTPNLHEAAALTGQPLAGSEREMEAQARAILAFGPGAVLIKGGHGTSDEAVDLLVDRSGAVTRLVARRIATKNTHGTGCTLSSAIAANLAKGDSLTDAVRAAKDYVTAAIAAADQLGVGHGHGPLNHFYKTWSPS
ncbi:hydroxymethylpyrimidine/phosphomethylpyrimidine kinase [Pseudolabrys sp. Root1462]|uniref:bifunctional hydroxymethylpyrimidine kinase/phosphomethylpyrimidine kinase n=1 Tax=Pseudolabrys sp. Root1462 TaxID=1736466 RepID=UPI0007024398|nr:bifunctional hydroxymethylpyrimidine kinase/phosphomethylpyrimidine kinase [Pseudolabrys sp. Root1462]KQZ00185.1 hydroxymethylpyrimidine/phosphomethylpyrimidine kinase [Pseudolabrys sp. Root1462]